MSFAWKEKPEYGERPPDRNITGSTVNIPSRDGKAPWFWLAGAIIAILIVFSFSTALSKPVVRAASGSEVPLECLSCHTRVLKSHDILGQGNQACRVCHDSATMGELSLLDGTNILLTESSKLCGQCHQQRYGAWEEGTHGVTPQRAEAALSGGAKLRCIDCHDPHQPRLELSDINTTPLPTAATKEGALDCLSCHVRVLKGHDKLGEGSEACWSCHYSKKMEVLHLASGETKLPLSDYPQLCAQCHRKRYEEWVAGTHGVPAWGEETLEAHGVEQVRCAGCHNPHQPQLALLNITKPHPASAPDPPSPPGELLAIVGISLFFGIALTTAMLRQGRGR
ncbi:MAG: hypothetical protein Q8Q07_05405 [Dehalococcoidales bacterium]|nr:hypothetical protein [Dehalococcoidales bacterium]